VIKHQDIEREKMNTVNFLYTLLEFRLG